MKSPFIEDHSEKFPIRLMCQVLSVSTSGFYSWKKRPLSPRGQKKLELLKLVEQIHRNSRKVYGAPRITHALRNLGHNVHGSTISRWMREAGIAAKTKRKFRLIITDSNHKLPIAENKLERNFSPPTAGSALSSDITYIPTMEGWLYLAVTIDLFSRRVFGYSMDSTMEKRLVLNALRMASGRVQLQPGVFITLIDGPNMRP